jgi:Rifampin ADP-ribosyl transferase
MTGAAQYFHASSWAMRSGDVIESGRRPPTFRSAPDTSGVYMSESESDAERWGNAIASETGAIRIYVYEVEPCGEVSSTTVSLMNDEGFHEPMVEQRARSAVVRSLCYSYDPVTGDACYPPAPQCH